MTKTDSECVRAVLSGDTTAYGVLYDRYARLVRAVCFDRTGDLTDAQDLAQEVFLRGYRKLDALRDADRFGPWLMGMTRFVCLEWRRRNGRLGAIRSLEPQMAIAAENTPGEESLDHLHAALQSLPARERLAVHAFYLQDQSAQRAREMLGLSRSGFYRVLQRARTKLRKILLDSREDGQ